MAITRGCGTRQEAGIYCVSKLSPMGRPIEEFLIDPPIKLNPALGVSPVGVTLITDTKGVTHILDYVGSKFYPNVADFIEEVRRFGLSRRLPRTLDYSRLTKDSRIILIHARAHIENTERYWQALGDARACPCDKPAHQQAEPPPMCAELWWKDVEGGAPDDTPNALPTSVRREMPSFHYYAARRPDYAEPLYRPAMFLRLPLTGIEIIRARDGSHEQSAEAAGKSGLPVTLEDE